METYPVMSMQLDQIALNPMFPDLRSTLRTECDSQQGTPAAILDSLTCHNASIPLSTRVNGTYLRFQSLLKTSHEKDVEELQNLYQLHSSRLETTRCNALYSASGNSWLTQSIQAQYDQLHHDLLDRIEKSLTLAESSLVPTKTSTKRPLTVAHKIMSSWYDRNSEHPYPSYETAEVMAKAGNISVEQVKKWFSNQRRLRGHTKSLTQIAQRRKRTREETDDVKKAQKLARFI